LTTGRYDGDVFTLFEWLDDDTVAFAGDDADEKPIPLAN
jgi:hypothetical protein